MKTRVWPPEPQYTCKLIDKPKTQLHSQHYRIVPMALYGFSCDKDGNEIPGTRYHLCDLSPRIEFLNETENPDPKP